MHTTLIDLWDRLSPGARATLRTLVTVALNGAGTAISAMYFDPTHFNGHELKHVFTVAGLGAAIGVINWLRKQPWVAAQDDIVTVSKTTIKAGVILLAVLLGGGALATLPGCASSGTLTPVGQVAKAADQVEQTGLVILHAAQAAHQQTNPLTGAPVVSTAQLDQVAIVCDKLGRLGTSLAQALPDYNAAKASGGDTSKLSAAIQALVGDATAALQSIGKIVPSGTVQAMDQAVAGALGLYAQIRAAVL